MTGGLLLAAAFATGLLLGFTAVTAATRQRARLRERDRLAMRQHDALTRALSLPQTPADRPLPAASFRPARSGSPGPVRGSFVPVPLSEGKRAAVPGLMEGRS